MKKILASVLIAASLGGCATVPAPLQGSYATSSPRDTVGSGQAVRWGGEIIRVDPKNDATCFEVLAHDLDDQARPRRHDEASRGRFIACASGFYDPEEYDRGRDVTFVGALDGTELGKVGEFDYTYPRVKASQVYLWPRRLPPTRTGYYDPWFGGFGAGWYGPWGPYWNSPPIIIRQVPHPHPRPRSN